MYFSHHPHLNSTSVMFRTTTEPTNVVSRLLEIHDNEHDDEHDNENILTLAEEDDVYKPYGFWIGRPKGPNKFRVPKPSPFFVTNFLLILNNNTINKTKERKKKTDI